MKGGSRSRTAARLSSKGCVSKDLTAKMAASNGPASRASWIDTAISGCLISCSPSARRRRKPCCRSISATSGRSKKTTFWPLIAKEPPIYVPIAPAPNDKKRSPLFGMDLMTRSGSFPAARSAQEYTAGHGLFSSGLDFVQYQPAAGSRDGR